MFAVDRIVAYEREVDIANVPKKQCDRTEKCVDSLSGFKAADEKDLDPYGKRERHDAVSAVGEGDLHRR